MGAKIGRVTRRDLMASRTEQYPARGFIKAKKKHVSLSRVRPPRIHGVQCWGM